MRAGFLACLLVIVLSACTRPTFLHLPEPDTPVARPEQAPPPQAATATPTPAPSTLTPSADAPARQASSRSLIEDPDLWRTIGAQFTLSVPPRMRDVDPLKQFGHSRRFIATATARAAPFLSHVYGEIKRRHLPAEIALIPLIESAYNNSARSARGPAGLWQFIPATGTRFGLRQSPWYDGRQDVIAGTRAALDYFELLRDRFDGDWLLVFAAYNCGERTVEQAIARNRHRAKPTDFWSLDLPAGTRHYIPRLLDLAAIIRQPAAYGVSVARISSRPYFEPVDVGGPLELRHVARKSGLYPNEFDMLNAAYRRRATVAGGPTTILVANGFGAGVNALVANLPPAARGLPQRQVAAAGEPRSDIHVVSHGDNLWDIARRYGTTPHALAQVNRISTSSTLHLGQRLHIPASHHSAVDTEVADLARHAPATHYQVRSGDSLWTISRRFNVTVAKLRQWNGRAANRMLQPGERLVVQQPTRTDEQQKI